MDATNIMVGFCIIGEDFNPEIATKTLQINPSQGWIKGENTLSENRKMIDTCWLISTGYEKSLDINEQLSKVLLLVKHKKDSLLELKNNYCIKFLFSIVINIENNQTPAIYFDTELIEFANSIKAEFSIDLYVFS